jgi:SAM-dependent methyltransferase
MDFIEKLKTFLFGKKKNDFYENMFVKDDEWNKKTPNDDEGSRWKEIQKFLDTVNLNKNISKVFDYGCGRGWLANLLKPYGGGGVWAYDPEKEVIKYAKKLFDKIKFFYDDINNFILNNQQEFDLCISSEVIEHVPNNKKDDFLRGINKILKKGGYLIITTPRAELREQWEKEYSSSLSKGAPQPVEDWISTTKLKNKLKAANFRVLATSNAFTMNIYQIHLCQKLK